MTTHERINPAFILAAARVEMARFGFDQNQNPHPIFCRLARLRTTPAPSRKVLAEIDRIEAEIERSMVEAEAEAQARYNAG